MLSHLALALALVLPPLPDMSSLPDAGLSPTATTNWVIPGRLRCGLAPADGDGSEQLGAPLEPTLQALAATIAVAEPTVRAGETVLHVYGGKGSAELVCACLMAQLYQLSADEGLARVSAYAALRDTTHVGALAALTDAQKQLCRDLVRIRRASDCADE